MSVSCEPLQEHTVNCSKNTSGKHLFTLLLYEKSDHLKRLLQIRQLGHQPSFSVQQLLLDRLVGVVVAIELPNRILRAATCVAADVRKFKDPPPANECPDLPSVPARYVSTFPMNLAAGTVTTSRCWASSSSAGIKPQPRACAAGFSNGAVPPPCG